MDLSSFVFGLFHQFSTHAIRVRRRWDEGGSCRAICRYFKKSKGMMPIGIVRGRPPSLLLNLHGEKNERYGRADSSSKCNIE